MGRQKKRTMKKYNHSRRKNNTRRKTHKKRVRKTHKKRTHKRMKGGSREGLISGETKPQSTSERVVTMGQTLKDETGSLLQSVKDKVSKPVSPTAFGYEKQTDATSPEPIQLPAAQLPAAKLPAAQLPAAQLPAAQLPAVQPPALTSQPEQVVAPSSNPSKNKEILKHVASGLGGAAIYSNPMAALGTAAGVAGAVGAYKLGQRAYRGIGSAVDKRKANKLMKNIKECLETLISYAVISEGSRDIILEKLRKNSGYFDGQGNAPKITFKKELRDAQIQAKDRAYTANQAKIKEKQYALNVGETPETVVNTAPQQLQGSPPSSTDVTLDVGAGTAAQPFTFPSEKTDTTSSSQTPIADTAFDFLKGLEGFVPSK